MGGELPPSLHRWGYYGLALLLVAAAALLRWVLRDILSPTPFLVFYLAWVGAAVSGGLGPGLLATVASWLCVDLLFDPTPGHIGFNDMASVGRLMVLLTGGLAIGLVGEKMRRARIRARRQTERLTAANAALRESEEKYRFLVEKINDWVWELDANGVYTYASPHARELLGYAPEEVVGKTPFDFMPPAEAQRVRDAFQPIWLARKPLELLENTLVRKDGRLVTVETRGMPVFAEDGSFRGYTGIDRDVTARKRAEETLRRSEERLRLALASGGMGEWEWDLRTDSLFWCERIYQLLGLDTFRQARLETFLDRVYVDDRQAVKKLLAEAVNERKDLDVEFRILRSGQEPRGAMAWLAFHATVVQDEQGQALRMIGVMYDITPRKQMEEELRRLNNLLGGEVQAQTEELRDRETRLQAEVVRRASVEDELRAQSRMLEAFFQHTVTPLAFLDPDFNYVRINQAYAEAAGKDPEYFVAQNYFALHPSEENRLIFEQVRRTQQPYHAYAKPFEFGAGPHARTRYWNWRLTPLFDAGGQVQFLVLNLEDVTARQKAFQELEQRARQLQRLTLELSKVEERERERLAEILHDDLQQTLAAAKFHLGLVSHRCKGDAKSWETIEQAKQLLMEAIGKSRSLSHELSPPGLARNDLGETFEWLASQMRTKHDLAVHMEVSDRIAVQSAPLKVLLYRAAQELLFNISKHARVHEARLRLRRRNENIYMVVADKGCGLDPQKLGKTAGFGLRSIQERVALLGGRLKVRSTRGKGSTFRVVVPDRPPLPTNDRSSLTAASAP